MEQFIARYEALARTKGGFAAEFQEARHNADGTLDYHDRLTVSTSEVRNRNRYCNILTFEDTRVKLQNVKKGEMDYINASYVRYLDGPKTIVAQAPLEHTTQHFWQMCWEQDVPVIVMLTKTHEVEERFGSLREKSFNYFPHAEADTLHSDSGDFSVQCIKRRNLCDGWIERILKIVHRPTKESKQIAHIHCLEWPDYAALKKEQLEGLQKTISVVEKYRNSNNGLAIVHCSAGIGRSGTFVAIESLLAFAAKGQWEKVNPKNTVVSLRVQRPGMVQTSEQYAMIYDALTSILTNTVPAHIEDNISGE